MSTEPATQPVVEETEVVQPVLRAMKAKGKGKGKKKAKAKAKGKKAGGRKPAVAEGEEGAEAVKKVKPLSLKAQVAEDLGNRNPEEVLAEARQKVKDCDSAIAEADTEAQALDREADAARKDMEATSAKVEELGHTEAIALEKLKAARRARNDAATGVAGVKSGRVDAATKLKILELELESRQKLQELADARKAAQDAQEAAKKAIVASKIKEKEALDSVKRIYAEQAEKENEAVKDSASSVVDDKHAQKDAKVKAKTDAKAALSEMVFIDKARIEREKLRQINFREAAGFGKKKKQLLALGFGALSPKRTLAGDGGAPAKAARVEDVD